MCRRPDAAPVRHGEGLYLQGSRKEGGCRDLSWNSKEIHNGLWSCQKHGFKFGLSGKVNSQGQPKFKGWGSTSKNINCALIQPKWEPNIELCEEIIVIFITHSLGSVNEYVHMCAFSIYDLTCVMISGKCPTLTTCVKGTYTIYTYYKSLLR